MENVRILINTLFSGPYLDEQKNIGYEFVNLFRDDNRDNHLCITPDGALVRSVGDREEGLNAVI